MAAWRRAIELSLGDADLEKLRSIAQSRTEPASRVERARILLGYWKDPSFFAVGQVLGLHHQTVQRCVERAAVEGPMAALDDRRHPGKEPTITMEAKAWLTALACRKAKDFGYPHELWTTRLLARHAREHGPAEGHACLATLVQGTVCKILDQEEVKPHKVRYYLERRGCGHLLRREARDPGDRNDGTRSAAPTRRAPHLRPRPRIQAPRHSQLAGGHRPADRQGPRSGQGSPPQPRVHRVPEAPRRGLPSPHGDPPDPRQSFRAHLQADASLARRSARRQVRVHLHSKAWLLAQSRRGLLLQARTFGPAPHPRRLQIRAQGAPHGRHRLLQRRPRRSHLDLQAR